MAIFAMNHLLSWTTVLVALFLLLSAKVIYQLYFHPLAKFPGPKLAAITTWYEGYYDIVKKGRYTFELARLHDKYGPIIRVGPNEVHIRDSSYYNTLYCMTNRLDKASWFYGLMGSDESIIPTVSSSLHRIRRHAMSPFFSNQAVSKCHPLVQKYADRLVERMWEASKMGEAVPLISAYRCVTADIILEYTFGRDLRLSEREDWGASFYSAWRTAFYISVFFRQCPWLLDSLKYVPRSILEWALPKVAEIIYIRAETDSMTREVLAMDPEKVEIKKQERPMIIWELAHSETLPEKEKTFSRMADEGNLLLVGGFETTSSMLVHLTYNVLADEEIHRKLKEELETAIPDPENIPSHKILEKLPYLTAVIKETLRLDVGTHSRLPRVNPNSAMQYKDWVIPAGSALGMSSLYVLHDPLIFPSPTTFNPTRWLDPNPEHNLDHYLVTFGRGPRSCVGINLAWAEMYTISATLFRRLPGLRLFETEKEDVETVSDYFSAVSDFSNGRVGLRVVSA